VVLDSSEYGIREILLVAGRSWLPVLGVMILVAGGSGYLSYSQANADNRLLRVDSVVSLPTVDFYVTDTQSVFRQSVASIAAENVGENVAQDRLTVTNLGNVDDGRRTLVQLSIQAQSAEAVTSAMSRFLRDLALRVKARHPEAEGGSEDLSEGIADIRALLRQLRAQPTPGDLAGQSSRQLAIANSVSALAALEQLRVQLQQVSAPDLHVEVSAGPPFRADDEARSARWIRVPVVASLAAGFVAFLVALTIDAWPRLVGRR
jgi:hypothetical protein